MRPVGQGMINSLTRMLPKSPRSSRSRRSSRRHRQSHLHRPLSPSLRPLPRPYRRSRHPAPRSSCTECSPGLGRSQLQPLRLQPYPAARWQIDRAAPSMVHRSGTCPRPIATLLRLINHPPHHKLIRTVARARDRPLSAPGRQGRAFRRSPRSVKAPITTLMRPRQLGPAARPE